MQKETPLGAYAVEYLTYTVDETPRNYDAIQLTVGYRRTAAQVAGIVHITSTSALGDLLREAAGTTLRSWWCRWATSTIRRRRSAHR